MPGDTFRCVPIRQFHVFAMQAKTLLFVPQHICTTLLSCLIMNACIDSCIDSLGCKMGPGGAGYVFHYIPHTFRIRSVTFWGGPHKYNFQGPIKSQSDLTQHPPQYVLLRSVSTLRQCCVNKYFFVTFSYAPEQHSHNLR